MIPKSEKLRAEEAEQSTQTGPATFLEERPVDDGPIKIRVVPCCNEFVAILRFSIDSTVALPDGRQYKNEGIIIGVGPGLPAADGSRCPSQFNIGDVVMFQDRNVLTEVQSNKPPYQGKSVIIMSERNILCKLPTVDYEIIE